MTQNQSPRTNWAKSQGSQTTKLKPGPLSILVTLVILCTLGCSSDTLPQTDSGVSDSTSTAGGQISNKRSTESVKPIAPPPSSPAASHSPAVTPSSNAQQSSDKKMPQAIQNGKLEFRVGEGQEVFSFKPKGASACKFYGTGGKELCKLAYSGDKLKVKSADDQPLFELKPKQDKVMIKDATGEKELFKFKLKGDRIDFYLPGDKRTYRLKKRDYGWRLDDNHDNTLFRAKRNDQKAVLRDAQDQTVLYSKDFTPTLPLLFFRIDSLSQEQQAACFVFFFHHK